MEKFGVLLDPANQWSAEFAFKVISLVVASPSVNSNSMNRGGKDVTKNDEHRSFIKQNHEDNFMSVNKSLIKNGTDARD